MILSGWKELLEIGGEETGEIPSFRKINWSFTLKPEGNVICYKLDFSILESLK